MQVSDLTRVPPWRWWWRRWQAILLVLALLQVGLLLLAIGQLLLCLLLVQPQLRHVAGLPVGQSSWVERGLLQGLRARQLAVIRSL